MKSFTGTTQKCTVCEKTVYLVDKLVANQRVYHKACFRCHHCNSTLKLSNFNSFDGVVYCRHHFDQLFKRTGSLEKSFDGTPKFKPERTFSQEVIFHHLDRFTFYCDQLSSFYILLSLYQTQSANRLSSFFEGTRDKCNACAKIVYPIERVNKHHNYHCIFATSFMSLILILINYDNEIKVKVDGTAYHRACFKCCHGGCTISPSNYIAHEGRLYCKHHHIQLFKKKGNYSQLEVEETVAAPAESETQNDETQNADTQNTETQNTETQNGSV
ncbi:putative transcription factor interactor and regulator LIM family [Helianthus annuus]|nr:putative transcription factor interactor and regulator LIM family [Helianthus annuus]